MSPSRCFAFVLLVLLVDTAPAAAQDFYWRRALGTPDHDYVGGSAPDGSGGLYVSGATKGSLGGPNAGSYDIWMSRYNATGTRLWILQFGTTEYDRPIAAASDGLQGAFVGGSTDGDLGGPNAGGEDMWLSRFDGSGQQHWIVQFGTSGPIEWVSHLAPDSVGGVIACGRTSGDLGGSNAGGSDAWLARFDASGNLLWIRQFGTSETEWGTAVLEQLGSIYVCGITLGDLAGPSSGAGDSWLARYDLAGNLVWIRQFGSSENDLCGSLAADLSGGVFISGTTFGDFGSPVKGLADAWIAHYDGSGNQLWARQLGRRSIDGFGPAIEDGFGGVIVCGNSLLEGTTLPQYDPWLGRYDSSGSLLWVKHFGTGVNDVVARASSDFAGGIFLCGTTNAEVTQGTTTFDDDVWVARVKVN